MRSIFTLILILALIASNSANSQSKRKVYEGSKVENINKNAQVLVLDDQGNTTYIKFKKNIKINSATDLQQSVNLPQKLRFKKTAKQNDQLGFVHQTYVQEYNGIEIMGSEVKLHSKSSLPTTATGKVFSDINVDTDKKVTEAEALEIALKSIGANSYMWESDQHEAFLQNETGDPKATYYPQAKEVISREKYQAGNPFTLVYQFDIYASDPLGKYIVEVSAIDGSIINRYSTLHHEGVSGTGHTLYDGDVDIDIDQIGSDYYLSEVVRGDGIHTYDMLNGTSYGSAVLFSETDTYFNETNSQAGVSAHFGAAATYDYFLDNFGRNSFDDDGAAINSYVHYGNNYFNAFWDGYRMTYGDGDGVTATALVSLDIVGHEIVHAVTQYTANLVYAYEPGALNESFSDIFGQSIEFETFPATASWNLADQIYTDGVSMIRSMSDPNSQGQPDTYLGDLWYYGSGDNGGVHYNSGVQNFWYFLLVEGGSGTNDNGYDYNVTSIGLEDAQQIAYRNLTVYLSTNSEYVDARAGAELAAIDLFGAESQQYQSVVEAWNAVGVPSATPTLTVPSELVFGNTVENQTKTIDLNVSNTGLGFLSVTDVSIDDDRITVSETAFTVGENSTYQLPVSFTPDAVGEITGMLTIASNAGNDTIDLSGTGVEFPSYALSETSLSFDLIIGNSASSEITVTNNNAYDLTFTVAAESSQEPIPALQYQKSGGFLQTGKKKEPLYKEVQISSLSGEDDEGLYYWKDSDSGASYTWEDISGVGSSVSLGDDSNSSLINIGFSFPFYENSFEQVAICSNGWISFTNTTGDIWSIPLPSNNAPENVVAIMAHDLYPNSGSCHYYFDSDNNRFIIQYTNWSDYSSRTGDYTMQYQLYPNGTIKLLYEDIDNPINASVGIQNQARDQGMTISYNDESFFSSNYAVEIGFANIWLSSSVDTLEVSANSEASFDVQVNAEDILAGNYEGKLLLAIPELHLAEDTIDVTLHVVGAPNIEIAEELEFETAYDGYATVDSIEVFNVGTDVLELSNINFKIGTNFTADLTELSIDPQSSYFLNVTFSPTSSGEFADSLMITTNDTLESLVKVYVTGEAVEPPVIAVSPESLTESLNSGETSVQYVGIDNSAGGTELLAAINVSHASVNFKVAENISLESNGSAVGSKNDPRQSLEHLTSYSAKPVYDVNVLFEGTRSYWKPSYLFGYLATELEAIGYNVHQSSSAITEAMLDTVDILVVASPNSSFAGSELSAIDSYVNAGGSLFMIGEGEGGWIDADALNSISNMFDIDFEPMDEGVNELLQFEDHPITDSVATLFMNYPSSIEGEFESVGYYNDLDFLGYANQGRGKIAVFGDCNPFDDQGGKLYVDDHLQLATNIFHWLSSSKNSWLSTDVDSLNVAAGGSGQLEVHFDADKLFGGTYEAEIDIVSNDPLNGYFTVPVTLEVTGVPEITADIDTIDFETAFTGYPKVEMLQISNQGTDSLGVTSIVIENTDFTVDTLSFGLQPNTTIDIEITYNPAAAEVDDVAMWILSDDPDQDTLTVYLSAEGLDPPIISVSPETLNESLLSGDSSVQIMTIDNSAGGSQLDWELSILADIENEFAAKEKSQQISSNSPASGVTGNQSVVTPLITGFDVLDSLLTFDNGSDGLTLGGNMMWNSVGGGHLFCEAYNDDDYIYFPVPANILSFKMNGLPWENYGSGNIGKIDVNGYDISGDTIWSTTVDLTNYSDWNNWYTVEVETEGIYYLEFKAPGGPPWNNGFWPSIDSMQLGTTNNFVYADVSSGSTEAGEDDDIDITFNAKGLYGGSYEAELQISSNDPANPSVSIPISLDVTGVPDIAADIDTLHFGTVYVGYGKSDTLRIVNEGSDSLGITSIAINNPDFAVDTSAFGLQPNDHYDIVVSYNPLADEIDDVALWILSNDPDQDTLTVMLKATGLAPPVIAVNPESFSESLMTGDSSTQMLTIDNSAGGSILHYELEITGPLESPIRIPAEEFVGTEVVPDEDKKEELSPPDSRYAQRLGKYNFDVPSYGATNVDLEEALENLNASYESINQLIPERFDFTGGENGYSINDGGRDMYDGGNYLNTSIGGSIPYTNGTMSSNQYLGGESYFTAKYPGLFVFAADVTEINSFYIYGNLGADGGGSSDASVISLNKGSKQFVGFVKRVYHAGDPSVNHLIIMEYSEGAYQTVDTNTNSDFHEVVWSNAADRMYYLLFAADDTGYNGYYVDDANMLLIMDAFLEVVGYDDFVQLDRISGSLAAGSSENIEVSFNASGLLGGIYESGILIHSNDSLNPAVTVPVTLDVTGVPTIVSSRDTLDFGQLFVGAQKVDSLTIFNHGSDSLGITSIVFENPDFTVDTSSFGLQPGEYMDLLVSYNPQDVELDDAAMWLLSNDPYQDSLTILLKGEGLSAPSLTIEIDSLYENLLIGDSSVHLVNISNPGGADLVIEASIINRYRQANNTKTLDGPLSTASKEFERKPITPRQSISGDESVLIIQDWNAWGVDMNSFILDNFGISATVINASDLNITDLSDYDVVITTGDQGSTYYNIISDNAAKFEQFAREGGVVQYQLATQGPNVELAGGATIVYGELEFRNNVVNENHPIVYDLPQQLEGNYANHCYVTDLPENAHIIVETENTQLPTLVEYSLGSGRVIATGMTVEYLYKYNWNSAPLLSRLFEYSAFSIGAGWLTTNLTTDTISAGASHNYEFKFNTKDLEGRSYFKSVVLKSNDPLLSELVIPVELLVDTFRTYEAHEHIEVCFGDTYFAEGAEQSVTGVYYDTLHFVNYDSVFVTHLTVMELNEVNVDIELCDGEFYVFGSQVISEAGVYTEIFPAANSCDSVVNVTAHINPLFEVIETRVICAGDSFVFGTLTLTDAGSYIEKFASQSGCDSTVFLTLEIAPVYEEEAEKVICYGETFEFGTQSLSTSGAYSEMFVSSQGCDSLVTLNLTVEQIDSDISQDGRDMVVAQENANYQWMDYSDNMRPIDGAVAQRFRPIYSGVFVVRISTEHCSVQSQAFQIDVITALEDEKMQLELNAFPSPTNGPITVHLNRTINSGRYYIIDFGGKIVESSVVNETDEIQLNIKGSSGIYLFRLIDQDDHVYTTKISKR